MLLLGTQLGGGGVSQKGVVLLQSVNKLSARRIAGSYLPKLVGVKRGYNLLRTLGGLLRHGVSSAPITTYPKTSKKKVLNMSVCALHGLRASCDSASELNLRHVGERAAPVFHTPRLSEIGRGIRFFF